MDEIDYKLNTKNSVLIVNAIDKLLTVIKSKFKLPERQKFVVDNEELKFLREKCSSNDYLVSLTACQGLLALVELGLLEIGHTMSTVLTLLPATCNYSALISTISGLLILDLKSRLVPGQPYKCQFSLKSPQHPFISVLQKSKGAQNDIINEMQTLLTHPDYTVSSNSVELLRPVFVWLTGAAPERPARAWQLLLAAPQSPATVRLLLTCLSCMEVTSEVGGESGACVAYCAVCGAGLQGSQLPLLLPPLIARAAVISRSPLGCYVLLQRCFGAEGAGAAPRLRLSQVSGLTLAVLADNLNKSSALHLHQLFNLCVDIVNKYEYSKISLNIFVAYTLQWLHLPSYLTNSALKVAARILEIHQQNNKEDMTLHMANLKSNELFQNLLHSDVRLSILFRLHQTWERIRNDQHKLRSWLNNIESSDDVVKLEIAGFLLGIALEARRESWFEEIVLRCLRILVKLVNVKKELSVQLLPVLLYKIANDPSPFVKTECLTALPLMAKYKLAHYNGQTYEHMGTNTQRPALPLNVIHISQGYGDPVAQENVPTIVSTLNKIKMKKGVPLSFLIMLYTSLAETQVRCFPYLKEVLVESTASGRADEPKWEVDVARAAAVVRICDVRASSQGVELVSVVSSLLSQRGMSGGGAAASLALRALALLWRGAAVSPPSTWRALQSRLAAETRPAVIISMCSLLGAVPALRVQSAEYDELVRAAARRLWGALAAAERDVAHAAADALAHFRLEDYTLKDVPDMYRSTVKLPAAYCKTPADAARPPEDVLDYIPCEVWGEVFRLSGDAALDAVERLLRRLVERELRASRGAAHQPPGDEPASLAYLPAASVFRGVYECFRKQIISPSHEYSEASVVSMLRVLGAEYSRPPPPADLSFLCGALERPALARGALQLAARAAPRRSALGLLDSYLHLLQPETAEESKIIMMFELLPVLCRSLPPNTLRPFIERSLSHSYRAVAAGAAVADAAGGDRDGCLFVRLLELLHACLDCDKIHDANRTLLSQILEGYFVVIDEDNLAWSTYVQTCLSLPVEVLERMTSVSAWWDASPALRAKCAALRGRCAAQQARLAWLAELVDAYATHPLEQENSLWCMWDALAATPPDAAGAVQWLRQLLARTQQVYNESDDDSVRLYYVDVVALSAAALSGVWRLAEDGAAALRVRDARLRQLPAALGWLLARPAWSEYAPQVIEWLLWSLARSAPAESAGVSDLSVVSAGVSDVSAVSASCAYALAALRHAAQPQQRTRLLQEFDSVQINIED